jgi:N-acetylmuramic acid 6-phosphate etherase
MDLLEQLAHLTTEAVNPRTLGIDMVSTREVVEMLQAEDMIVAEAVGRELDAIARAVDVVADVLASGGRLIYVGAGTSGRLGILDASEMPPTYGVDSSMIQGIIAGGRDAVFRSVEGAEDSVEEGVLALEQEIGGIGGSTGGAVVCGLSASGRTPFVLGALEHAHALGLPTIFVSTNAHDVVRAFAPYADIVICPQVGPEPIAGSTRMKSGTAQKMVINMITTAAMVRMGKTYGNVMVDLQLSNEKLRQRALRIVMEITGVDQERAAEVLRASGDHVKTALVMAQRNCSRTEAETLLADAGGHVRKVLTQTP